MQIDWKHQHYIATIQLCTATKYPSKEKVKAFCDRSCSNGAQTQKHEISIFQQLFSAKVTSANCFIKKSVSREYTHPSVVKIASQNLRVKWWSNKPRVEKEREL